MKRLLSFFVLLLFSISFLYIAENEVDSSAYSNSSETTSFYSTEKSKSADLIEPVDNNILPSCYKDIDFKVNIDNFPSSMHLTYFVLPVKWNGVNYNVMKNSKYANKEVPVLYSNEPYVMYVQKRSLVTCGYWSEDFVDRISDEEIIYQKYFIADSLPNLIKNGSYIAFEFGENTPDDIKVVQKSVTISESDEAINKEISLDDNYGFIVNSLKSNLYLQYYLVTCTWTDGSCIEYVLSS